MASFSKAVPRKLRAEPEDISMTASASRARRLHCRQLPAKSRRQMISEIPRPGTSGPRGDLQLEGLDLTGPFSYIHLER